MANYTIEELLKWMDGKSQTYGWDAIVAYDRSKTNRLLHQQYVERFNNESYLPLLTVGLPSSVYTTENLYGLKLSVPQLSFANANLASSRADLTMDMVGGLIVSELNAPGIPKRVDSIKQVLPLGGPQLTMTLPLEDTPGSVQEHKITLDISKGDNFRANFVVGDIAQETIGSMFKKIFNDLDPRQKVFSMGRLGNESNYLMTPERFQLRTMASPTGANRASEDYGEGAVMMFIQFVGGTPGNIPPMPQPGNPAGFRYLIPRADASNDYSGTMLLSSRILFKKILDPYLTQVIGKGLIYRDDPPTSDRASTLEAISGTTDDSWVFQFKCLTTPGGQPSTLECRVSNLRIPLAYRPPYDGHRVHAKNNMLNVSWGSMQTSHMRPFPLNPNWTDVYFDLHFASELDLRADIEGARGVVKLKSNSPVTTQIYVNPHDSTSMPWNIDLKEVTQREISARVVSRVLDVFNSIDVPGIDTFLSRNLLFSDHDALQLSRAYVPGDLAMFGHIDPVSTSMTISPAQLLLEAEGRHTFHVSGDGISNVLWSVRDSDGDLLDVGSINARGEYRAPGIDALKKGYVSVLVTAEGYQGTQPVRASALVSIIDSTIAANPIFQVVSPDHETTLSAESIDGSAPEWTLLLPDNGATLTPDPMNSHHRIYKAGPKATAGFTLDTVQVKARDGKPKVIKILIPNFTTTLEVRVEQSGDPSNGWVKVNVFIDNELIDPQVDPYTLTLLYGGGELDAVAGLYKPPSSTSTSFAIITVAIGRGSFGHYGFLVLPLPLANYGVAPALFDQRNPSAAWCNAAL